MIIHSNLAYDLDGQLDSAEQAVFLAICHRANDMGICWPSRETICRGTSLSLSTVFRAIGRLVEKGYISIISTGRDFASSRYLINAELLKSESTKSVEKRKAKLVAMGRCVPASKNTQSDDGNFGDKSFKDQPETEKADQPW